MDAGARGLRGEDYDAAFDARAQRGIDVHGEAQFVESLGVASVLDAGCGTGRVAIELDRRGHAVVGVDIDASMLGQARRKAPDLAWVLADLATLRLVDSAGAARRFDAAVMAGNVLLFVEAGTEGAVVDAVVGHLRSGGLLVAGFQLAAAGLTLAAYDALCAQAGLRLAERWSTWDRTPWTPTSAYAVSVHRRDDGQ